MKILERKIYSKINNFPILLKTLMRKGYTGFIFLKIKNKRNQRNQNKLNYLLRQDRFYPFFLSKNIFRGYGIYTVKTLKSLVL